MHNARQVHARLGIGDTIAVDLEEPTTVVVHVSDGSKETE